MNSAVAAFCGKRISLPRSARARARACLRLWAVLRCEQPYTFALPLMFCIQTCSPAPNLVQVTEIPERSGPAPPAGGAGGGAF